MVYYNSTKKIMQTQTQILVLGQGLLGQEFAHTAMQNARVISWGKQELDITNKKLAQEKITRLNPDVIINCAAYTSVDEIQNNKEKAYQVNGVAVKYLAETANATDAILVHYSTDYVFDGTQDAYTEQDAPATTPLNEYGVSKLQGEQYITRIARKFYIIRTAWLFGNHGNNFVQTVLRLARSQKPIQIVDDEYGRPTYAPDLVQATLQLLERKKPYGIYHITNSGEKTSWYQYAQYILQHTDQSALTRFSPTTSKAYNAPAPRPRSSVLLNTTLPELRPWQSAVKEYLESL